MEGHSAKRAIVAEQAAEWLLRLGTASAEERREFYAWLKKSPVHVREILLACSVVDLMQQHRESLSLLDASDDVSNVVELVQLRPREPARETGAGLRSWRLAACACLLAIATLLATAITQSLFDRWLETAAAEWKTATLSDGSKLQLGPRSRVRIDIGDQQRRVWLARGEMFITVAEDAQRPFVAETESATARAVGTQFAMALRDERTIVTVTEGLVHLSRPTGPESITLSADQQATVSPTSSLAAHEVDAAYELAWRNRRLVFKNETLAEAVAEFNRRNKLQLKVEDRSIESLPIRGSFAADDPSSFAEALQVSGMTAVRTGDAELLILPRRQNPTPERAESDG